MDPEGYGWTNTEELLAGILERVDLHNVLYLGAHGVKPPKVFEVRRPWQPLPGTEPVKMAESAELKRFFEGKAVRTKKVGD